MVELTSAVEEDKKTVEDGKNSELEVGVTKEEVVRPIESELRIDDVVIVVDATDSVVELSSRKTEEVVVSEMVVLNSEDDSTDDVGGVVTVVEDSDSLEERDEKTGRGWQRGRAATLEKKSWTATRPIKPADTMMYVGESTISRERYEGCGSGKKTCTKTFAAAGDKHMYFNLNQRPRAHLLLVRSILKIPIY